MGSGARISETLFYFYSLLLTAYTHGDMKPHVLCFAAFAAGALLPWSVEDTNVTCRLVNTVPDSQRCSFVTKNCQNELLIGAVDYMRWYYCLLLRALPLAFASFLFFSFVGLAITALDFLCPNLYTISKLCNMSEAVAGLTLLALGNGSADVISTYKAVSVGSIELALSELTGGAFFVMLVIVGSICICSPFEAPRTMVLEQVFYVLMYEVFLVVLAGHLNYYSSVLLVTIYAAYVVFILTTHHHAQRTAKRDLTEARLQEAFAEPAKNTPQEAFLPAAEGLSNDEDRAVVNEYEEFLKSHPHDDERRPPLHTGSYGIHVLLKELSKHSLHAQGRVQLRETPLTEPVEEPTGLVWRYLVFRVCVPDSVPEDFLGRVQHFVTLPIFALLRCTTPVRGPAIAMGESAIAASNAFTFAFLAHEAPALHDFRKDGIYFRLQFVCALFFLSLYYALGAQRAFALVISLVLSGVAVVAIPCRGPVPGKSALLFRFWNYVGCVLGFVVSMLWVSFFALEVIALLKTVAVVFELRDDILGATVFAMGNSIGDLVSNFTVARMGMPIMAFSACYGGPLLTLCSVGGSAMLTMFKSGTAQIDVGHSGVSFLNIVGVAASQALVFVQGFSRRTGIALIFFWVAMMALQLSLHR